MIVARRILLAGVFLMLSAMLLVDAQTPNKDVENITEKEGAMPEMPGMAEMPMKHHDVVERSYVLNDFYGQQVRKLVLRYYIRV